MAGVRRDGWTQSDPGAKGRAPASRGRQPGGPGSSKARAGAPFEPRRSCPELWFQFHDVTVQTCGLQAPAAAAAARPLARQARAPWSPPHARSPGPAPCEPPGPRGGPDPARIRAPLAAAGSAPHLLSSSWEAEAAAAAMLRPGASAGGAGGRRGGLAAVAVPRRAAPCRRGPGPPRVPHAGRAAPSRPARPAACVLRAASVAPAAPRRSAPRELATRALPLSLAPLRSRGSAARRPARPLARPIASRRPALIFRKS